MTVRYPFFEAATPSPCAGTAIYFDNSKQFYLIRVSTNRHYSTVSLTQTKKKNYETKQKLVEEIQGCCEKYHNIYIVETKNERNNLLKDVRDAWKHSRYITILMTKGPSHER